MMLRNSYFIYKRLSKDIIGPLILLVTPLALITVLGYVAGDAINENNISVVSQISIIMIITFQLFGGNITMEYIRSDITQDRKWKMASLPISLDRLLIPIVIVSTLYNTLQGILIVIYTTLVFQVNFNNYFLFILGILLLAFLSQLFFLLVTLMFKKYKTASRVTTGLILFQMFLGEVWYTFPSNPVSVFITTYGNIISLAENIFIGIMLANYSQLLIISVLILLFLIAILLILSRIAGKRKLV